MDNVPVVTTQQAHSGTFSAFVGDSIDGYCGFPGFETPGDSSFYQQFTVPASGGTLSFWHWDCTTDIITFDCEVAEYRSSPDYLFCATNLGIRNFLFCSES